MKTKLIVFSLLFSILIIIIYDKTNRNTVVSRSNALETESEILKSEIFDLLSKKPILRDYDSPSLSIDSKNLPIDLNVSNDELLSSESQVNNWIHPQGNYNQNRFYPGTQINISNVKNLKFAFTANTSVIGTIASSPIVYNGVMFVSTAFNNVFAFDATNGEKIWHFRYQNRLGNYHIYNCCGPNNRGLAIYKGIIFMATLDANLIAIDAKSGKLVWKSPLINKWKQGYSATAAPIVIDNKVIIGVGNGEYPIRGFVKAFDVSSGKPIWTFYTIPEKNHEGDWKRHDATGHNLNRNIENEKQIFNMIAEGKKGNSILNKYKDFINLDMGGGVWGSVAVDSISRTIFLVAGNPYPDFDFDHVRPGDNLYTNSLIAIDLDSGRYKWHFQYIPHDIWDLDSSSPPVLLDVKRSKDNKYIPAVMHASKMGNIFIHDRSNGELIRFSEPMIPQKLWITDVQKTEPFPDQESGVNSPIAYNPRLHLAYALNRSKSDVLKNKDGRSLRYGSFDAVDVNTGKIKWTFKTDEPLQGGVLATSGNLVFFGEGNGRINALNGISGEKLWTYKCDGGANAPPISYQINNKQYIAIGCGGNSLWGFPRGNKFYIFSLK